MHSLISYNYQWQANGKNHCYDMHNDQNQVPIRETLDEHELQLVGQESNGHNICKYTSLKTRMKVQFCI